MPWPTPSGGWATASAVSTVASGSSAAVIFIEDVLLVSIPDDIDDSGITTLQDRIAEEIVRHRARGVVIDISHLDVVDTFAGRVIGQIAAMTKLLSARSVVVGMRPAVAMTLVELGMTLAHIPTALNVRQAMKLLRAGDG